MGLFGSLAGKLGRLAGGALRKFTPAGGVASSVAGVAGKILKRNSKKIIAGAVATGAGVAAVARKYPAATGAVMGGAAVATTDAIFGGGRGRAFRSYRRINPANPRALRRAIRRVEAGARMYSKFFAFKRGSIKGARGVRVKKFSIRRKAA